MTNNYEAVITTIDDSVEPIVITRIESVILEYLDGERETLDMELVSFIDKEYSNNDDSKIKLIEFYYENNNDCTFCFTGNTNKLINFVEIFPRYSLNKHTQPHQIISKYDCKTTHNLKPPIYDLQLSPPFLPSTSTLTREHFDLMRELMEYNIRKELMEQERRFLYQAPINLRLAPTSANYITKIGVSEA